MNQQQYELFVELFVAATGPMGDPPTYFGEKWRGWNHFLLVDPNTPEGLLNIEKDKMDEVRLAARKGTVEGQ